MQTTIVGGGFAGISTAHHLARRGVPGLVVIEQEDGPGFHASGRNAGLLRRSSHDPAIAEARKIDMTLETLNGGRPSGTDAASRGQYRSRIRE